MNATFPEVQTVRTALAMAVRAPSVHNSQPWQWRVGEQNVHLYSDTRRYLPRADPDARDLIVSCGIALHHCVVAFAALGWRSKVHRLPDPAEPSHLAAIELEPLPPSDVDIALAAAVPRRRTDRRHYSPWPVPPADIALMGARAARAGVMLRQVEELDKLQSLVAEAARRHAADADYLAELTQWSGRHGSPTGVPARNTPPPDPASPMTARAFAGPMLQTTQTEPAEDHARVVALGTAADDEVSRLRAGEATSLVLLTATALGLSSCPVTEPLEIEETRAAVRDDVFGFDAYPQMLLRVGWAPINADPLPSTPRIDLAEVAVQLDGSPLG